MRTLILAAVLTSGASIAFAALPKLPKAIALPQSGDSPGVVTFNHESHVDTARPNCTVCHPKLFGILKRTAKKTPAAPVTHDAMKQGQTCGACHGKTSFGFEDDCSMCHR